MTKEAVDKILAELDIHDRYGNAPVRAKVNGSNLTLNEQRELVLSLGGTMCDCLIPKPIGPAGSCPDCATEGPFYRQAVEYNEQKKKARMDELSEITGRYKPVNWREVWTSEPLPVEWLVEPILEAGTINALFSKPGHGKSLVTMEMCLKVIRSGKVVIMIDRENRITDLVGRLRDFGAGPDELDNLIVFSFAELPPLDTQEGGEHLIALCDQYKPDLVTLDTISRLVQGDENASNTYLDLYNKTLAALKGRGICTLRLDHSGKDLERGQRGSSAKDSDVDTIWKLTKDGEDFIVLEQTKIRQSGNEKMVILQKHDRDGDIPLHFDWDAMDKIVDGGVIQIAKRLDQYEVPLDWGRDRAEGVLREHGVGSRHAQVGAALKYRRDQAKVSGTGGGQWDRVDREAGEWYH